MKFNDTSNNTKNIKNVYNKSETYNTTEIDEKINNIDVDIDSSQFITAKNFQLTSNAEKYSWLKICSIGKTDSALVFSINSNGDFGRYERDVITILFSSRRDTYNVRAFSLNQENVSAPTQLFVETTDDKYILWARFATYNYGISKLSELSFYGKYEWILTPFVDGVDIPLNMMEIIIISQIPKSRVIHQSGHTTISATGNTINILNEDYTVISGDTISVNVSIWGYDPGASGGDKGIKFIIDMSGGTETVTTTIKGIIPPMHFAGTSVVKSGKDMESIRISGYNINTTGDAKIFYDVTVEIKSGGVVDFWIPKRSKFPKV